MILQALYDYYQRKAADPESNIAPIGWEWKEIPYKVLIDDKGNFLNFVSTYEGEGKQKRAHKYLVPTLGEQKGSGIKANLFWENVEYLLGIPVKENKDEKYQKRVKKQHQAFIEKFLSIKKQNENHKGFIAIEKFIHNIDDTAIRNDKDWEDIYKKNSNLIFEINGIGIITDDPEIKERIKKIKKEDADGLCLVSGQYSKIARLHPPISGVRGAKTTGAGIVAVNNEIEKGINKGQTPAFASYMKQQGYNSPVSESSAFAYTTALNYLLRKNLDNNSKIYISDSSVVFWAEKRGEKYDLEENFKWFIDDSPKYEPDRGVRAVKSLYNSIESGKIPVDEGDKFYILGLSPNGPRISIRFWKIGTISDFAYNIKRHFDDLKIIQTDSETPFCMLNEILSSISIETKDTKKPNKVYFKGKFYDVPPNLAGRMVECILDGTPYPQTLLNLCINRIRAETSKKDQSGKTIQNITRTRAAILKACLNRELRYMTNKIYKEVQMALDLENKDIGYLLGRLFSVLERIQEKSAGGRGKLNSTIRDRYYGAFSSAPTTVLPTLMKLKKSHISKLPVGSQIWFEDLITEIVDKINAQKIPAHMTLKQQAQFAVGYYHQRFELNNNIKK